MFELNKTKLTERNCQKSRRCRVGAFREMETEWKQLVFPVNFFIIMGGTRISVLESRQSWNYHSAQASGSRLYLFLQLNTLTNHKTLGTLALGKETGKDDI